MLLYLVWENSLYGVPLGAPKVKNASLGKYKRVDGEHLVNWRLTHGQSKQDQFRKKNPFNKVYMLLLKHVCRVVINLKACMVAMLPFVDRQLYL